MYTVYCKTYDYRGFSSNCDAFPTRSFIRQKTAENYMNRFFIHCAEAPFYAFSSSLCSNDRVIREVKSALFDEFDRDFC